MVGVVEEVAEEKVTSTYILKVRTATNFYSVQHAYIVKNLQKAEMDSLEKAEERLMSNLLKNIIRFALFILFQVFVLDKIPPLHRFMIPYLYFLFIFGCPLKYPVE